MKKLFFKLILALSIYGAFSTTGFSQGWAKKYAQSQLFFLPMLAHQQPDQTYAVIGTDLVTQKTVYQRISVDGSPVVQITHDSIALVPWSVTAGNGDFGVVGYSSETSGTFYLRLMRLNSAGQKLWLKQIAVHNYTGSANVGIDTTNDGGFVAAYRPDSLTISVVRTDSLGNVVWTNDYPQLVASYVSNVVSTNDGGFVIQKSAAEKLFKIDASGNLLWQYSGALENAKLAKDGNLLLYGNSSGHPYIKKIDQDGNDLWSQQYPLLPDSATINFLIEKESDKYAFITHSYGHHDVASNVWFRKYNLGVADANGNYLFLNQLPTSNFGFTANILTGATQRVFTETTDNGYFITGWSSINGGYGQFAWAIKTDSTGRAYPSTLSGYVYDDANSNCLRDNSEQALVTNITISNATDTFIVAATDSGFFSLGVNAGTYSVSLESISPYWVESSCNLTTVNLANNTDSIVLFGYNAILHAPYIVMSAETRAGGIPLFAPKSTYTLQYENLGTESFFGHIEVQIDSNLVVDSASIPYTAQVGNVFSFSVQPLAVMGRASFNIYYHALDPTDLDLIDRTLCFNAHAYSDTVYSTSSQWDLSNLEISANYNASTDSVEFLLRNKGLGGMSSSQALTVIEDNVILISTPVQLSPNQTFLQRVPANGSTWRATINQTPHNPYSRFVTVAIEGAGTNGGGTISTGFVNQYPINGFYGFDYTLCSPVVASYDPNHKYVSPEGVGAEHLIDSTMDLDYTITFQNTGTFQAYTVRIIDTLASYLNPSSIRPGVSSHQYEMNFLSKNVVEFLFNNINLPDSASDEEGSQGFVKFKIKQQPNNEIGTVINNDVAIYFDYNEPVITNTATVKIGKVTISNIQNLYNENVEISAYPNPFSEQTIIKVKGENFDKLELNVFDVQGRNVRKMAVANGNQFTLKRDGLVHGMYVFEIRTNDKTVVGTGRIVVK